jgi:hypothetical protein
MTDTDPRPAMVAKLFALIVLLLAVSPFHAPFQVGTGEQQQIASVEPLSGTRLDGTSQTAIAQSPGHEGLEPHPDPQVIDITSEKFAFGTYSPGFSGDYRPSLTILRL